MIKTRTLSQEEREALDNALVEKFDVDDISDHNRKYFFYSKFLR